MDHVTRPPTRVTTKRARNPHARIVAQLDATIEAAYRAGILTDDDTWETAEAKLNALPREVRRGSL